MRDRLWIDSWTNGDTSAFQRHLFIMKYPMDCHTDPIGPWSQHVLVSRGVVLEKMMVSFLTTLAAVNIQLPRDALFPGNRIQRVQSIQWQMVIFCTRFQWQRRPQQLDRWLWLLLKWYPIGCSISKRINIVENPTIRTQFCVWSYVQCRLMKIDGWSIFRSASQWELNKMRKVILNSLCREIPRDSQRLPGRQASVAVDVVPI